MQDHSPEDYPVTSRPLTAQDGDASPEEPRDRGRRLILILITLLVVLAMLATLVGPMLRSGPRRPPTPTSTPVYFQTA